MSFSVFRFMANLDQCGSWIPDAEPVKFICQKSAGISKIKKAFVLKGIFSETTSVCELTCQI